MRFDAGSSNRDPAKACLCTFLKVMLLLSVIIVLLDMPEYVLATTPTPSKERPNDQLKRKNTEDLKSKTKENLNSINLNFV